jgi:hypothetical protein
MNHEDDNNDNDGDAAIPGCEPDQKFRAVVFLRILGFCFGLGDFNGGALAFQIGDAVGLSGNRTFCIFERLSNCGLVGCQLGVGTGKALYCAGREAGREGAESGAGGMDGEGICYFWPDRPGGVRAAGGKQGGASTV